MGAGICVLAHDAQLGDEVDGSAEESLAYASGYERSAYASSFNPTSADFGEIGLLSLRSGCLLGFVG